MPILDRPNAKINYDLIGHQSQNVITLVNGHTRSSSDFRMMARVLNEKGLSVLLLDNRGAGKSEYSSPFSVTDMCEDVVSLWDELGIRVSDLLGISMGGFISQGIALMHPTRVGRLALVSTAPEERFINPTGGGWISEGTKLEEKMRSYFAPGFVDRNPILFNTMVTQIRQALAGGTFTARSDMQRAALKGAAWTPRLKEIAAKTLIIHGEKDLVIDLDAAYILRDHIPGARLEVIAGAGHLLLAEAPKELYRIAADFFLEGLR